MDFSQGIVDDPALNNIASVNTRQTLLIVNDFIAHTVDFMNKFAVLSEQKLYNVAQKTEKLEILISLLEAKLESVPLHETDYQGNGTIATTTTTTTTTNDVLPDGQQGPLPPGPPPGPPTGQPPDSMSNGSGLSAAAEAALQQINAQAAAEQTTTTTTTTTLVPTPNPSADGPKIKDDPRYAKYFTMLARGVPVFAVKQKVKLNGEDLDDSILDLDPETPVSATALIPYSDNIADDDSD